MRSSHRKKGRTDVVSIGVAIHRVNRNRKGPPNIAQAKATPSKPNRSWCTGPPLKAAAGDPSCTVSDPPKEPCFFRQFH
jgi:hypothetical protein